MSAPRHPGEPVPGVRLLDRTNRSVSLAVAAGGGIGVLPASAAARHTVPGVRFVPLSPAPSTELAALTRDEPVTSVAALLKLMRRVDQLSNQAERRVPARV